MALTPILAGLPKGPSTNADAPSEGQRLAGAADLTKAARYTLISLPRQSIGRLALKYRHVGHPLLQEVAKPTLKSILYGPKFALMDRFSQSYVMARESLRHALGHIQMGAIHYKRDTRGFSFRVWSMACDSVINNVLEHLPAPDQARDSIRYGVRRCEELGIVKWDDVKRQVRKTAQTRGIEPGPVFDKEPSELNSLMIYQAIMKVVREVSDAQKAEVRVRSWDLLMSIHDGLVERSIADPTGVLRADPVELRPHHLYDALARVVRVYNDSAYPADHEGDAPVDVEDWKLLSEAVHALVAKAVEDPAHVFTDSPRRRSISLWNDLVAVIRAFVDFEDEGEASDETIIDEIADELNLIETLRDAIEEAAKEPEANLINQTRQIQDAFRRMQAGAGSGDALLQIAPPSGLTRTPWRRALASMASTALITRFSIDPTKPSRRSVSARYQAMQPGTQNRSFIQYPRLNRHGKAKKAVFIIDTSGSIFCDRLVVEQLLREAVTVCKRVNTTLTIIFADAAVQEVISIGEAYETIRTLVPRGGGGTDFRPGIARAEEMSPDLIIYATDLCGTFPSHKPKCPIIWAYPPEWDSVETPFGLRLPLVP